MEEQKQEKKIKMMHIRLPNEFSQQCSSRRKLQHAEHAQS
jgi:hypothetical protein